MTTTECARNIKNCALKGLLADLALNRDDDREALSNEAWAELLDEADMNGNEFHSYDGPAHTF